MLDQLGEDLVGDGRDVDAGDGGLLDVVDASDGSGDDLRLVAEVSLDVDDILQKGDAIPPIIVESSEERGDVGCVALHRQERLGGGEAQGDVGWDVCLTDKGPCLIEGNEFPGHDIYQLPPHRTNNQGLLPIFLAAIEKEKK